MTKVREIRDVPTRHLDSGADSAVDDLQYSWVIVIQLRHLRVCVMVADQGSVTKAATALYRAQSAITRSIQELEAELGVSLFERRAHGMLPTAYGDVVLLRARRAMSELEAAKGDFAELVGAKSAVASAPIFSMLLNEQRLRIFVALSESGHMPTVAEGMSITQPAVSAAIRELEGSLGFSLFDRTPKGMLPSAFGEMLAMRAKRALAEIRHAEAEVAALQGRSEGTVTVGALPLGRTLILPRAVVRLLRQHPGIRVATVEGPFDRLAASLRSGDVDFVFGALRPSAYATDLVFEPLLEDELSIVVRSGHPLTEKPSLVIADIAAAQWVLPRRGVPTRDLSEQVFSGRGIPLPAICVDTSDLAMLRGLLLEGDLVTAISSRQLHHELQAGVLVRLPIKLPETLRKIGFTSRLGSRPSPGATLLMNEIRVVCQERHDGGTGVTRA